MADVPQIAMITRGWCAMGIGKAELPRWQSFNEGPTEVQLSRDPMHILCAADRNYGPWLGVMVTSVLLHDHGRPVVVHVFSDGIRSRDLDRLKRLSTARGASLRVYELSRMLDEGVRASSVSRHLSRTTYARLFLARFIDPKVSRILYLDCDITCVAPLGALWVTDLGDAQVAAAPHTSAFLSECRRANERIGAPTDQTYFNAGVLLIDLERWRNDNVEGRLLEFLAALGTRLEFHDQDALNGVLGGTIHPLEARWNFLVCRGNKADGSEALIHFVSGKNAKPWHRDCNSPLAVHFLLAKRLSPWRWLLRRPYTPYKARQLLSFIRKFQRLG